MSPEQVRIWGFGRELCRVPFSAVVYPSGPLNSVGYPSRPTDFGVELCRVPVWAYANFGVELCRALVLTYRLWGSTL